jgi:hypothetical protein
MGEVEGVVPSLTYIVAAGRHRTDHLPYRH